jgi:hypothetical protein
MNCAKLLQGGDQRDFLRVAQVLGSHLGPLTLPSSCHSHARADRSIRPLTAQSPFSLTHQKFQFQYHYVSY